MQIILYANYLRITAADKISQEVKTINRQYMERDRQKKRDTDRKGSRGE